jgi:hypothetical protein
MPTGFCNAADRVLHVSRHYCFAFFGSDNSGPTPLINIAPTLLADFVASSSDRSRLS